MQVKIFYTNDSLELDINVWLNKHNNIHIHHVNATARTEDYRGMLYIFYDIDDKYAELVSAIRGEK